MQMKAFVIALAMLVMIPGFSAGCGKPNDNQITNEVRRLINADSGLRDEQIDAAAPGGVVTLSGIVDNTSQWDAVATYASADFMPASYGQDEKKQADAYSGVAMGTGGSVGGRTIQFDFRITGYTTDEEVNKFAALLKEKGPDALRSALEKENKGQLNPVGRLGNDIAVARKREQGKDTIITIVTARVMPFIELYKSGRSTDYPFGFLQVKLNEKGEGTGQIMAAAKIRFNKRSGRYEIESYGNQYIKAVNVRPWK